MGAPQAGHAPQLALRCCPQLSVPLAVPQLTPRFEQNAASPSYAQPHALGVPPPPQVSGLMHEPQLMVRDVPQLSVALTFPQLAFAAAQKALSP